MERKSKTTRTLTWKKLWTFSDRSGAYFSRALLACTCFFEVARLLMWSGDEWVNIIDESSLGFPLWLRFVHGGALFVLMVPRIPSSSSSYCHQISAFVAFIAHFRMFVSAMPVALNSGTRLQLLGLFAHVFISQNEDNVSSNGLGVAFLRISTCAMYASTAINKLRVKDSAWLNGTAVRKTLSCGSVVHHRYISESLIPNLIPDAVTVSMTWLSLAIELGAAIFLTICVSNGKHLSIIHILAVLILFQAFMGAIMHVGLFSLTCCANLLYFLPSRRIVDEQTKWLFSQRRATSNGDDDNDGDDTRQRRNWTMNGTSSSRKLMLVTSSSSHMLSTTISIALLSIVSIIPKWREMWHVFTTPPKACGKFLVAVKRENQRGETTEFLNIVYDERQVDSRTDIDRKSPYRMKLRSLDTARYILMNEAEMCVDGFVNLQGRHEYCADFFISLAPKLASHACSTVRVVENETASAVMLWFGRETVSWRNEQVKGFSHFLLFDIPCSSATPGVSASEVGKHFPKDQPFLKLAPQSMISLLERADGLKKESRGSESNQILNKHGISKGWENKTHLAIGYDILNKSYFETAELDRNDDDFLVIHGEIVMARDEQKYMNALAKVVTSSNSSREILEIGFGMGISSGFIQDYGCARHVIVEVNDEVFQLGLAWQKSTRVRSSVEFIKGYASDVLPRFSSSSFDGIFVDPFPSAYDVQLFAEYRRVLRPDGNLAFFLQTTTPNNYKVNSENVLDIAVEMLRDAGWEDSEIGVENWELIVLPITKDCLPREDAKSGLHDSLCPIKDYGFYITNITRKGDDRLST
jgi:predicted methyltransferase